MHYDSIVIGAGSMGMAASYYLAKEGYNTLCIDAFTPPHDFGSHHGDTRLIRYAYGEGEQYVPFVLRAKKLWEELSSLTERQLFHQVGVLNFSPENDPHMKNIYASSVTFDLPIQRMNAADIEARWPGITVPNDMIAYYEPTSGVLFTEAILRTYYELATAHGMQLHANDKAVSIDVQSDTYVEVTTASGQTFSANNVIISVGAWSKELLASIDVHLPITPIRKTFAWYEADEALYGDSTFPGFAYINNEEGYYGFPSIDGAGLKVGRHDSGQEINPNDPRAAFGEVEGDKEDLQHFLQTFMPQVGELKFGKTCMYAMTPDEHFIIDTAPRYKNVAIAGGFSGHGFKFASAVGEALKDLVTTGETKVDLSPFAMSRFL